MESLKAFFLRSSLIGVGSSWEFDATFWDFIHGLDQCLGVWFVCLWHSSYAPDVLGALPFGRHFYYLSLSLCLFTLLVKR